MSKSAADIIHAVAVRAFAQGMVCKELGCDETSATLSAIEKDALTDLTAALDDAQLPPRLKRPDDFATAYEWRAEYQGREEYTLEDIDEAYDAGVIEQQVATRTALGLENEG